MKDGCHNIQLQLPRGEGEQALPRGVHVRVTGRGWTLPVCLAFPACERPGAAPAAAAALTVPLLVDAAAPEQQAGFV